MFIVWIHRILFIHDLCIFGMFSSFGYYKCCYKHLYTTFCVDIFSVLLSTYLGVELLGYMLTLFNFVRNFQTGFYYCYILQSHHFCVMVLILQHPRQNLLSEFFIIDLPLGMNC